MSPPRSASVAQTARAASSVRARVGRAAGYVALVCGTRAVWQVVHLIAGANLVSGPADVLVRAVQLAEKGTLQENLAISAARLAIGWAIGCAVAIPLGLLMAQIPIVRRAVEPYLHF